MASGSFCRRSFGAGWKSQAAIGISLAAVLGIGLAPSSASALAIGGAAGINVSPVYFNTGGNFGLNTGIGSCPCIPVGPTADWALVGPSHDLSVQISLQTPVLQNPQFPTDSRNPTGPQGAPTQSNPFVADSLWTVTNISDGTLNNAYLVFEGVDLSPTSLVPRGYPNILVGIDRNLFSIVDYTYGAPATSLFFGAVSLGSLGAGDSTQIRVRYIVAGPLPPNGNNLVMPVFELASLTNVPEPGTLVLLGSGLVLCAAAGRRRCA